MKFRWDRLALVGQIISYILFVIAFTTIFLWVIPLIIGFIEVYFGWNWFSHRAMYAQGFLTFLGISFIAFIIIKAFEIIRAIAFWFFEEK